MKLITIVGARPQFIKAAVVSRAIAENNRLTPHTPPFTELIVHTGQHYDQNMSDVFFEQMEIPKPHRYLNINQMGHGAMTGRMLEAIESVFVEEEPDMVLVYGDTNSTLAGALAAVKLHIPVAHVEAGLRSYNQMMPEEVNRVLTDQISTFLFCPTQAAIDNLSKEGFTNIVHNGHLPKHKKLLSNHFVIVKKYLSSPMVHSSILFKVGDVMYDAALFYSKKADEQAKIAPKLIADKISGGKFILATLHREENADSPIRLQKIISAFIKLSEDIPLIWPVHPRTRKKLDAQEFSDIVKNPGIILVDPLSYFDMIVLLKHCTLVLTDSGGLQKESYFFKKPCVTMRYHTEWIELVEHGCNKIVGADQKRIVHAVEEMMEAKLDFDQKLYGDGDAGRRIVKILGEAGRGRSEE
jgi:UDP-GlcNAc3NAcA epimerase